MHGTFKYRWLVFLLFLLFFLAHSLLLAEPLWDSDLWWHLATGKQIAVRHHLLQSDPFNFTTLNGISPERSLVLNYCWLGQLILYAAYKLAGAHGPIAVRIIILTGIPLLTLLYCRSRKVPWQLVLPFIMLEAWVTLSFTGERPQLFSFLFFLSLVVLLLASGSVGNTRPPSYDIKWSLLIPPLMLVWSNIHPASILGAAVLLIIIAGESLRRLTKGTVPPTGQYRLLIGILVAGMSATLATPAGTLTYKSMFTFEGSRLQAATSEYISPLKALLNGNILLVPYWIYVVAFVLFLVILRKHLRLTEWLLCLFLFAISLSAYRYIPFFVFGTVPIILIHSGIHKPGWAANGITNVILPVSALVLSLSGIYQGTGLAARTHATPVAPEHMPVKATDFIAASGAAGRLFNHFNWGGYLIWHLYPQRQVFIDGRALNTHVFEEYTNILWTPGISKKLLDKYEIRIVIIPAMNTITGELYALVTFLATDPEWHLVYQDATALVMCRGDENRSIIEQYGLPKNKINDHINAMAARRNSK